MSDAPAFRFGGRYWAATLLLPFTAFALAMAAYAFLHGYLGVPEADAGGDAAELLASMLEVFIWMVAILAFEYAVLIRLYPLDLRSVVSWKSPELADAVLGGTPAMLSGWAGFALALTLGRTMLADDPFAGDPSLVFALFPAINGVIIAPRIDLGEKRRAAADRPAKDDVP